jgi:CelD/BcsL family acetyltransferase involved in cellulose biosynthesis
MSDESIDQSVCPVLDLLHESAIPPRKRRKLRMAENRVSRRRGEVIGVGSQSVPGFLDDIVRLHGARWATRGEDGVLADDPVRRFHAAALPQLVAAGLARLSTLTIEGQVVGAYYGLHHGPRAYAYLGGFDPDFAFESPGTVLVGHAIETARQEGATEFHFLRGQEPYKYEWGAADRPNRRRTFRRDG